MFMRRLAREFETMHAGDRRGPAATLQHRQRPISLKERIRRNGLGIGNRNLLRRIHVENFYAATTLQSLPGIPFVGQEPLYRC